MKIQFIGATHEVTGSCTYLEPIRVGEGVTVRFTDVGHLLGSAAIALWLTEGGDTRKIVFSGDVGNTQQPIIKDPQPVEEADYLVIESTYGNRLHEKSDAPVENAIAKLTSQIRSLTDKWKD